MIAPGANSEGSIRCELSGNWNQDAWKAPSGENQGSVRTVPPDVSIRRPAWPRAVTLTIAPPPATPSASKGKGFPQGIEPKRRGCGRPYLRFPKGAHFAQISRRRDIEGAGFSGL